MPLLKDDVPSRTSLLSFCPKPSAISTYCIDIHDDILNYVEYDTSSFSASESFAQRKKNIASSLRMPQSIPSKHKIEYSHSFQDTDKAARAAVDSKILLAGQCDRWKFTNNFHTNRKHAER